MEMASGERVVEKTEEKRMKEVGSTWGAAWGEQALLRAVSIFLIWGRFLSRRRKLYCPSSVLERVCVCTCVCAHVQNCGICGGSI